MSKGTHNIGVLIHVAVYSPFKGFYIVVCSVKIRLHDWVSNVEDDTNDRKKKLPSWREAKGAGKSNTKGEDEAEEKGAGKGAGKSKTKGEDETEETSLKRRRCTVA